MNSRSRLILATCLCIAAVGTANADQAGRSLTVRYDDTDLATSEGAAKLYGRIRYAAKLVCSSPSNSFLTNDSRSEECRSRAIDKAVKAVDNRTLMAMHGGTLVVSR